MNTAVLESAWAVLTDRQTTALLVIRHDRIVFERYAPGYGRTKPHYTASMAKALVGGLSLMLAMEDGRISPDDPAHRYVPQWRDDPKRQEITSDTSPPTPRASRTPRPTALPHDRLTGWKGDFWKRLPPPRDPFTTRQGLRTRSRFAWHEGTLQQPRHGDARLLRDGEPPRDERRGPPLAPEAPYHETAGRARCGMVDGIRHRDARGRLPPGGDVGAAVPTARTPWPGSVGSCCTGVTGRETADLPIVVDTAPGTAACQAIPVWGGG